MATIVLEPYVHNGYDLDKQPRAGFMVHYGQWRYLLWRATEAAALRDGEDYLRETGRWGPDGALPGPCPCGACREKRNA